VEEENVLYAYYGESAAHGEDVVPRGYEGAGEAVADDAMTRSEEHLEVGTEEHETGRARLRKVVVTEEETVTVPVSHEELRVVREPITDDNREAARSGEPISQDEYEVVLHEERPVVSVHAEPVERVRLTTETVVSEEAVTGEVRKEQIEVEGVDEPSSG
jgi:uncharacterized protein (TIGR02271 family)